MTLCTTTLFLLSVILVSQNILISGEHFPEHLHPHHELHEEFGPAKMSVEEIMSIVQDRYNNENLISRRQARSRSEPERNKRARSVAETCATSASLVCGKDVLRILGRSEKHHHDSNEIKCNMRKDFLDCVDAERENCRALALKKILPELPSEETEILNIQGKVWRALWTSGGCLLA